MLFSSMKLATVALSAFLLSTNVDARPAARQQLVSRGYRTAEATVGRRGTGVKVAPELVSSRFRASYAKQHSSPHRRSCNATEPAPAPQPEPTPEPAPVPEEPAPEPAPVFPETFNNPIKPGGGADPWVVYFAETDMYYLCQSQQGGLVVTGTKDLTQFTQEGPVVWTPPPELKDLWAPELHWIDDAWYIYVAMDDGANENHRMYVLKGTSRDPTQRFDLVGKITSPDDNWAIDGTVFRYADQSLYFVWSGWPHANAGFPQNLYIAKMCSPTEICSERVLIHEPIPDWQKSGGSGVNEGPTMLEHNGRWFLVYSSAGSWGDDYNLAFMGIDGGVDPMNKGNWWALDDRPVMWSNPDAGVWAPGHASFVNDRAGTSYVVYHAVDKQGGGWGGRSIRAEPFGWNPDGSPAFPRPVGFDVAIAHPQ